LVYKTSCGEIKTIIPVVRINFSEFEILYGYYELTSEGLEFMMRGE